MHGAKGLRVGRGDRAGHRPFAARRSRALPALARAAGNAGGVGIAALADQRGRSARTALTGRVHPAPAPAARASSSGHACCTWRRRARAASCTGSAPLPRIATARSAPRADTLLRAAVADDRCGFLHRGCAARRPHRPLRVAAPRTVALARRLASRSDLPEPVRADTARAVAAGSRRVRPSTCGSACGLARSRHHRARGAAAAGAAAVIAPGAGPRPHGITRAGWPNWASASGERAGRGRAHLRGAQQHAARSSAAAG